MKSNIHTLFIISSWDQAQTIQKSAKRQMLGVNHSKVPVEQIDDWYATQGTIEWHDASRTKWKKQIQSHMQEKRNYSPLDNSYILMVIWNAQTLSEYNWYMWKDLKGSVVAWFISDCYCSMAKKLSIKIQPFPQKLTQCTHLEQAIQSCVGGVEGVNWKGILDVRKAVMDMLEWSECFHTLHSCMSNIIITILKEHNCFNSYTMGYCVTYGLEPLSTTNDPLGIVLRVERIVLVLLKMIYTQSNQIHQNEFSKTNITDFRR